MGVLWTLSQKRWRLLRISGSPVPRPAPGFRKLEPRLLQPQRQFVLSQPRSWARAPQEGWAAPVRPPAARHAQRRRSILEAHPSFLRKTCGLIRPPGSGSQNHPGTRTPQGRRDQSPRQPVAAGVGTWFWAPHNHSCTTGPPLTAARSAGCVAEVAGQVGRGSSSQQPRPPGQGGPSFKALAKLSPPHCSPSAWAFPPTLPEPTRGRAGGPEEECWHPVLPHRPAMAQATPFPPTWPLPGVCEPRGSRWHRTTTPGQIPAGQGCPHSILGSRARQSASEPRLSCPHLGPSLHPPGSGVC